MRRVVFYSFEFIQFYARSFNAFVYDCLRIFFSGMKNLVIFARFLKIDIDVDTDRK